MLTEEENLLLKTKRVAVVGCGGLGGYIIEMLGRIGVGNIIAIDGDVFEESNLNRQLLSDTFILGESKARAGKTRMARVNPEITLEAIFQRLDITNGKTLLKDCDIVFDALDNVESRLVLEEVCEDLEITIVHGAISSWYGQVGVVKPGSKGLSKLFGSFREKPLENKGNPSFTPATVASMQVAEGIKLLIGRGEILENRLLLIDLYHMEIDFIEI